MQPQAVPVSDFSILTKPPSRKTVASSDLAPDPSSGLNSRGVINQGFLGPFLLDSSCHDFEKVDKGRKMSSQLWVRMAGYWNYITYAGRKLNNMMWLCMAGYRIYIYIIQIRIYLFFCFTDKVRGTKTQQSDVATYGGRIHVYIFFAYVYLDNVSSLDCG